MTEASAAMAATEVLNYDVVEQERLRLAERVANRLHNAIDFAHEDVSSAVDNVVEFAAKKVAPVVVTVGVLAVASGCGLFGGEDAPKDDGKTPPTFETAQNFCKSGEWGHPSANAKNYNSSAFLPHTMPGKGELDSPEKVPDYIANLFRSPLGKNRDMASLAAVMTLVVDRATSGVGVNPDFDYLTAYKQKVDAYQGPDGEKLAKADCARANEVLPQLAVYTGDFAEGGVTIAEFSAVRGDIQEGNKTIKNGITDLHQGDYAPSKPMKGILLSFNNTAKDGDGYKITDFNGVLISTDEAGRIDGNFYVRGIRQGTNGNAGANLAPQLPPKFSIDNGTQNPTDVKVTEHGLEVTTINPKTGKTETKTIPCGDGGCNPGDKVEIPGIGTIMLPGVNPNQPAPTGTGGRGETPTVTTIPNGTGTTLPPITVTTTTGVTVTSAPPTTRPATTTTAPRTTTTRPAATTTIPRTTTSVPHTTTTRPATTTTVIIKPPKDCDLVIDANCETQG